MKTNPLSFVLAILLTLAAAQQSMAQGTFVYDQQSSDESYIGSGASNIQQNQPFGQSFTPTQSSMNFIRLYLFDAAMDSMGATIRINLRSTSISGTIISSTDPVSVGEAFSGPVNFFFQNLVSLTPGTQYYFQPEVTAGGSFSVAAYNTFGYSGGNAYSQGVASPGFDLWFREGFYTVPEPTAAAIIGLVGSCFIFRRKLN